MIVRIDFVNSTVFSSKSTLALWPDKKLTPKIKGMSMSQTTNFVRTNKPLSYKLITQAVLHVIELPFGNVISLLGKFTTGNYNA